MCGVLFVVSFLFVWCGWRVFLGFCFGCRVGFVGLFLWCAGVWVVFLVSLIGVSLHVSLVCVAGVGWVGVFWGYGCGVLVFCFWRFLCLLVVVFCRVLVLW